MPFTPGIIPRQRYKLAENIGQMVSKELLTQDTLKRQVQSESFRVGLKKAVSRLTDTLLNVTLGDLVKREKAGFDLLPFVEDLIRGFLRSAGLKRVIDLILRSGLRSLTSKRIGDLIGGEEQKDQCISWIVNLLRAPDTGKSLLSKATLWLEEKGSDDTLLGEYVPPEAVDWIVGLADLLYEPFFGFVTEWLESESMRAQIEGRGRALLKRILEKLSALQRFFVVATQYDRTLDEKMPEIIDDALAAMKDAISDDLTRQKMLDTIRQNIVSLRGQTIGAVNARYSLTSRLEKALDSAQRTIAKDPAGDSLKAVLKAILTQLENKSIESFLEGVLTVDDAADYLSALVATSVQDSADRISTDAIESISAVIDGAGTMSVRELTGVTEEAKLRLDRSLSAMAEKALAERINDIVDSLDFHSMVVSKINGLAVEDVEGLLMRVIHRHLKWINVFGAILGFLIGMMQILTRMI